MTDTTLRNHTDPEVGLLTEEVVRAREDTLRIQHESDSWQADATRTKLENHKLREALAMVTLDRDQLYDAVKVSLESIEKAVQR